MKKKLKTILVFALPGMAILSSCALYFEFAMRFILVVSFIVSILGAGIAFWDTYKGTAVAAKASYKFWKYFAAAAAAIMFGSFGLCMVALMSSSFMMSVVTAMVPLFGPVFGGKLGLIIKSRHP